MCRSSSHKNVVVSKVNRLNSLLLKCNGRGLEIYDVKLKNPAGALNHLYTVCLDTRTMRAKFAFQPRRDFRFERIVRENDIWGYDAYGKNAEERITLSKAYVRNDQRRITQHTFPNYYFNRGHLVPSADFPEKEERDATCEYINAAPQWDVLNSKGWNTIEIEVRRIRANSRNSAEWEIYTGTYGIIPKREGGTLFLASSFLPVPKLYWKILYNVNTRRQSRVFIGVNNPTLDCSRGIPSNEYKVCEPILNPKTNKIVDGDKSVGFTYECELNDFLKKLETEGIVLVY